MGDPRHSRESRPTGAARSLHPAPASLRNVCDPPGLEEASARRLERVQDGANTTYSRDPRNAPGTLFPGSLRSPENKDV